MSRPKNPGISLKNRKSPRFGADLAMKQQSAIQGATSPHIVRVFTHLEVKNENFGDKIRSPDRFSGRSFSAGWRTGDGT
jgi:hypothetical protein